MNKFQIAENLTAYLVNKTGSVLNRVSIKMNAKEQRELFGSYLGKGTIIIDGNEERLIHQVSVCFGQDYDNTFDKSWKDL